MQYRDAERRRRKLREKYQTIGQVNKLQNLWLSRKMKTEATEL